MARKAPRELRSFALRARREIATRLRWDARHGEAFPSPHVLMKGDGRGVICSVDQFDSEVKITGPYGPLFAAAFERPAFLAVTLVLAGGGEELRAAATRQIVEGRGVPSVGEVYESGMGVPVVALLAVDRDGAALVRVTDVASLADGQPAWGPGRLLGTPWIYDVQQMMSGGRPVPPLDMGA